MLLRAYIEDAISLSVEANRSVECLLFQVPLKGLFYYIVQYFTSALDGCCTCADFVYKTIVLRTSKWLVWRHGTDIRGISERKANSIINLENAFENANLIHLNRDHACFGIAVNLLCSIKYTVPHKGKKRSDVSFQLSILLENFRDYLP